MGPFSPALYHAPSSSFPYCILIPLSVLQVRQSPFPTWNLYTCCSLAWDVISLSWSSQPLLTCNLSLYVPTSGKPALTLTHPNTRLGIIPILHIFTSHCTFLPQHSFITCNLLLWGILI